MKQILRLSTPQNAPSARSPLSTSLCPSSLFFPLCLLSPAPGPPALSKNLRVFHHTSGSVVNPPRVASYYPKVRQTMAWTGRRHVSHTYVQPRCSSYLSNGSKNKLTYITHTKIRITSGFFFTYQRFCRKSDKKNLALLPTGPTDDGWYDEETSVHSNWCV